MVTSNAVSTENASAMPCAWSCERPKKIVIAGTTTIAPPIPKKPENVPPTAPTTAANGHGRAGIGGAWETNVRRAISSAITSRKIENAIRSVALGSNVATRAER